MGGVKQVTTKHIKIGAIFVLKWSVSPPYQTTVTASALTLGGRRKMVGGGQKSKTNEHKAYKN